MGGQKTSRVWGEKNSAGSMHPIESPLSTIRGDPGFGSPQNQPWGPLTSRRPGKQQNGGCTHMQARNSGGNPTLASECVYVCVGGAGSRGETLPRPQAPQARGPACPETPEAPPPSGHFRARVPSPAPSPGRPPTPGRVAQPRARAARNRRPGAGMCPGCPAPPRPAGTDLLLPQGRVHG